MYVINVDNAFDNLFLGCEGVLPKMEFFHCIAAHGLKLSKDNNTCVNATDEKQIIGYMNESFTVLPAADYLK